MGLTEKMNYLKETKKLVDDFFEFINYTECKTFREKLEFLVERLRWSRSEFTNDRSKYISIDIKAPNGNLTTYNNKYSRIYISPKVRYSGRFSFPENNLGGHMGLVDFSNYKPIEYKSKNVFSIDLDGNTVSALILPEIFYIQSSGYMQESQFGGGLRLGRMAVDIKSYWLSGYNLTMYDRNVYCAENFEGDMYLSKFPLTVNSMIGLFENLKDLTNTGEKYIFNIGSKNLAKLTEEQKDIARKKGWDLT